MEANLFFRIVECGETNLEEKIMKILRGCLLVVICCAFMGCAAMQIALEKKDLKLETKMSDTIFLDIENQLEKSIYVDIRNTSDKDIDVKSEIIHNLQANGYNVKSKPRDAFYILQANILYVGKADPSALRESLYGGYGGALAGSLGGALIGGGARGGKGAVYGAGIGGLVGGAAELVTGSLVKDVTYSIVTDLMISEKSSGVVTQTVESDLGLGKGSKIIQKSESKAKRKRYQTRVLSTANKVNLKFEEAIDPLVKRLARSIAGIF